jgi:hypothetical protein
MSFPGYDALNAVKPRYWAACGIAGDERLRTALRVGEIKAYRTQRTSTGELSLVEIEPSNWDNSFNFTMGSVEVPDGSFVTPRETACVSRKEIDAHLLRLVHSGDAEPNHLTQFVELESLLTPIGSISTTIPRAADYRPPGGEEIKGPKLSRTERRIVEAVSSLWPTGIPPLEQAEKYRRVSEWIKNQYRAPPHTDTIRKSMARLSRRGVIGQ